MSGPTLGVDAALFAALGDETRLQLIARLSDGTARPIADLTSPVSMSRQAITKHLNVLERAGLVSAVRAGRERRYTLEKDRLEDAQAYLQTIIADWDSALRRLQQHVER